MNATLKKFYNLYWTDNVCQEIFSVHRAQLLENEVELILSKETYFSQRLVLTNSLKRNSGKQIVKRAENQNIELMHELQVAAKKYFNEEKMLAYVQQKFGKTINAVESQLSKNGGWFKLALKVLSSLNDEEDLVKLLKEYYLIPEDVDSVENLIEYIEKEVVSSAQSIIQKENLYDLALTIDLVSTYYNHKIKDNLLSATKHYMDVLYDTENYKSRLEFFDELYEIGILKGGKLKGYYECVKCSPNVFNGILTTDIQPSSLKLKCPSCNKETLFIVPFELDEEIYKHILDKDGLLFHAIQYLLEEEGYDYKPNQTFLKDIELDFCLSNEQSQIYEVIEVKMFKTNRPNDTQVGNIRDSVSKMKKAIKKLSEGIDVGYKSIPYSLVTNIVDEEVYNEANKQLKEDLNEYNIKLYSIEDFYIRLKS